MPVTRRLHALVHGSHLLLGRLSLRENERNAPLDPNTSFGQRGNDAAPGSTESMDREPVARTTRAHVDSRAA